MLRRSHFYFLYFLLGLFISLQIYKRAEDKKIAKLIAVQQQYIEDMNLVKSLIKSDKKLFSRKGNYIGFERQPNYREFPNSVKKRFNFGLASYYNYPFHGRKTANGEFFNTKLLTAASPYLPLPCVVKVVNLDNGKFVYVRVNDRGPYINHTENFDVHNRRIIDLSEKAISLLEPNYKEVGLVRVAVELDEQKTLVLRQQLKLI